MIAPCSSTPNPYRSAARTRCATVFAYQVRDPERYGVVEFDDAQLRRFQELFIQPEWLQPPHLVGYDRSLSANPFAAFDLNAA